MVGHRPIKTILKWMGGFSLLKLIFKMKLELFRLEFLWKNLFKSATMHEIELIKIIWTIKFINLSYEGTKIPLRCLCESFELIL